MRSFRVVGLAPAAAATLEKVKQQLVIDGSMGVDEEAKKKVTSRRVGEHDSAFGDFVSERALKLQNGMTLKPKIQTR